MDVFTSNHCSRKRRARRRRRHIPALRCRCKLRTGCSSGRLRTRRDRLCRRSNSIRSRGFRRRRSTPRPARRHKPLPCAPSTNQKPRPSSTRSTETTTDVTVGLGRDVSSSPDQGLTPITFPPKWRSKGSKRLRSVKSPEVPICKEPSGRGGPFIINYVNKI